MSTTIVFPPYIDGNVSLKDFFPEFEGEFRIDNSVKKFLDLEKAQYVVFGSFAVQIRQEEGGTILDLLRSPINLERDMTCAIISYIGNYLPHFLEIEDGQDEQNLLVGRFMSDEEYMALIIEHEHEHGKEEIHLHARALDREENEPLYVCDIIG